ncbi:MAG: type II toxin-antitoxin system VapC family toxin [Bryobacteraceae bacterium]
MKRRVYIETSVVSYLVARPSANPVTEANRLVTLEWWTNHRWRYETFASELVLAEASKGDAGAASRRLTGLAAIPLLPIDSGIDALARSFVSRGIVPKQASDDAMHIAVTITHGMDFLLTWNCRHIANPEVIERLEQACLQLGFRLPVLCTPAQMVGNWNYGRRDS